MSSSHLLPAIRRHSCGRQCAECLEQYKTQMWKQSAGPKRAEWVWRVLVAGKFRLTWVSCEESGRHRRPMGQGIGGALVDPYPAGRALVSQAAEEPIVRPYAAHNDKRDGSRDAHRIVMLRPLPLPASECHHSGKGSRSVRQANPGIAEGKREGPRVPAAVRRSPPPWRGRRRNTEGPRSAHDEFPAYGPPIDRRPAPAVPGFDRSAPTWTIATCPGCGSSW